MPRCRDAAMLNILLLVGALAAAQAPTPRITLTDVTREAGITARHDNGAAGAKLLPETMGAGAAFVDYDNDGHQDLLLVNGLFPGGGGGRYASLYRNDGTGRFTDVSVAVGLQGVTTPSAGKRESGIGNRTKTGSSAAARGPETEGEMPKAPGRSPTA